MTPDEIRSIVRDELASLGGHLLSVYGSHVDTKAGTDQPSGIAPLTTGGNVDTDATSEHALARLGGYLLEQYGQARGSTTLVAEVPPWRSDESLTASDIAYRDPTPPAVGEPPTTTPGNEA